MKVSLTLILSLLTFFVSGQQITLEDWKEQSKTNIRLLPKYGLQAKTKEQQESDKKFIDETLQQDQFKGNRTAASNHMISLGFNYLYRADIKTAMYRFNQAYLLDSLNTDIFWGYGAVFMTLGDYEQAKDQYQQGLAANPQNPHLLTDFGTWFMAQYYALQSAGEKEAAKNLDTAITYLLQSYSVDKTDQNTTFKLSICYWLKDDCDNARKYYKECEALGGDPITEEYTRDLKTSCP